MDNEREEDVEKEGEVEEEEEEEEEEEDGSSLPRCLNGHRQTAPETFRTFGNVRKGELECEQSDTLPRRVLCACI